MPEARCNTTNEGHPLAPPEAWAGVPVSGVIVAAPGPSLTGDVVDAIRVRRWREPYMGLIAVTGAAFILTDADIAYAGDAKWWDAYQGLPDFGGERWTQDKGGADKAAERWGLNVVRSEHGSIPPLTGDTVAQGHNSAFQAVNLAVLFGVRRIVLVGLDLALGEDGRRHPFGDYAEPRLNMDSPYGLFIRAFEDAAPVYAEGGVEIVNASTRSALTAFPRVPLTEALR